jgi:hypothetical protein
MTRVGLQPLPVVILALVARIHEKAPEAASHRGVDGRNKCGHDEQTRRRHRERRSGVAIQYKPLDCFVGYRLLAMTSFIVIFSYPCPLPGPYPLFVILALVARIHEKAPEAASHQGVDSRNK